MFKNKAARIPATTRSGDIISKSDTGSYAYGGSRPHAVTSVTGPVPGTYAYDADGDMTSRNGYAITWTVDNLPSSIGSALGTSTFNYDPDGSRYYQAATFNGATTDTTYIGGLFEVVSTSTTTEYRHNIMADGEVIAVHTIDQSGNATTRYLHYDHLGSVDTITDDQGNVAQTMSFDAFGLRRDAANWDYDLTTAQITALKNDTDRGYTFQEQLDNIGLIHMNGRVYDPSIGRFISADPTVPDPLYSQSFNRYSYVYNSPLVYIDPSGLGPNGYQMLYGGYQVLAGYFETLGGEATFDFGGAIFAGDPVAGVGLMGVGLDVAIVGSSDEAQGFVNVYDGYMGNGQFAPDPLASIVGSTAATAMDDLALTHSIAEDAAKAAAKAALAGLLKSEAKNHMQPPKSPSKTPSPTNQNPGSGGVPSGSSFSAGSGYDPYSGVTVTNGDPFTTTTTTITGTSGNQVTTETQVTVTQDGTTVSSSSSEICMTGGKVVTCPK